MSLRIRFVRLSALICAFGLVIAASAEATPVTGPVYPPTGGVTWAPGGAANAGLAPGRDWNYSNFDDSLFLELYWGPMNPAAGLNGSTSPMTFAGISGTVATWNVVATYNGAGGSNPPAGPYTVRLEVDIAGLGANPWLLEGAVDGLSIAAPGIGAVVDNSSGLDFTANLLFSVDTTGGGSWLPVNDLQQLSGGLTQTSFGGGFFEVVPEPGTASLVGLGLLALGARRRSRR